MAPLSAPLPATAAEISNLCCHAVRTAKFVARKQWVVCGADDMYIRVYNYNTMDKLKHFEAHTDYIRYRMQNPGVADSTWGEDRVPPGLMPSGQHVSCLCRLDHLYSVVADTARVDPIFADVFQHSPA